MDSTELAAASSVSHVDVMKTKAAAIAIFAAVIGAVIAYGAFIFSFALPNDTVLEVDSTALIGDSFGLLNTLFSGLAFAGVIITILLQREELKLQREELAKSSIAQQRSARLLALSELLSDYKNRIQSHEESIDRLVSGSGRTKARTIHIVNTESLNKKRNKIIEELESILNEDDRS